MAAILRGPEPDVDCCCAWTRADLCRWLEAQYGKTYHPSSMTRVLLRLGFSRQKARPFHPKRDVEAQEAFKKGVRRTGSGRRRASPRQADRAVVRRRGPGSATRAASATAGGAAAIVRRAGWHVSRDLIVPPTITLVIPPPYSPEFNPVERVWLYLRERFLSRRLLHSTDAIIDAWTRLVAEPARIKFPVQLPVDREDRLIDSAV